MMMVEKEDLGLSLSLNFFHNTPKPHPHPHPLNLISSSIQTFTSSDRNLETCRGESGKYLRGIDVNRLPSTAIECQEEEEAGVSSPNSTVSSVSGKRSLREEDHDVENRENISDEEDAETARKKLRLSKDQSAILEETFKEHNTLNPKQKLALAKQLGLRPRQVEVWFQNRRARTKLKQTEVDCEVLKRCCENLTEENRRLQKEVQELRALKLSPQFYMQMTPPTTLTMCPSCERVAVPSNACVDASNRHHSMAQAHPRAVPIGPWASVYRIQRDLMNDFKSKELLRNQMPVEASFCSGPLTSQVTTEDGRKWHVSGFPVGNSAYAKTTVSGAAGVHSPLGSVQGISNQAGPFPSPDGCSLKDVGMLESTRPSKVRRKMFDLSLPADENVDSDESDEKLSDEKTSGSTLFLPDRGCKNGKEDDRGKTCCQDTSRSEQSLRRNGFADLNEPVQVDETYDSPFVHVPSNSVAATECSDLTASAKQKLQFFGSPREHLLNSRQGTDGWARNNGYLENNGNGKGGIPSLAEAGHAKNNLQPVPQVLKQEKLLLSSQTMQHSYNKAHEPASDYVDGRNKADAWTEKTASERNHEYSVNKHPESVLPLHRPGLFPAAPSYDLSRSWSHSAASWGMASCSLSQKLMSVQTPSCLNLSGSINRNFQSQQSNGRLEQCWPLNINSKPNPGIQYDLPLRNGFYPGSSSGAKEPSMNMSSISYDYPNHNNEKKSRKDIDLNVILSNGSYNNNLVPQSNVGLMDGDALSWLRAKTARTNEAQNTDRSSITAEETSFLHTASLSMKGETGKGPSGNFMHGVTSVSCSNNIDQRRIEVSKSSSTKKILGVPIFDMPHISPKKELSSITSPSVSIRAPSEAEVVENKHKNRMLDINLPCDANGLEFDKEGFIETVVSKTRSPTAVVDSRNQIDLNLSMSEDEGSFTTIPSADTKKKDKIDLEAPAVPKSEEDLVPEENKLETSLVSPQIPQVAVEQPQDELMRNAAEAIVVLSSISRDQVHTVIDSPSESSMEDPLGWFVDVVSSCKDNLESKCDNSKGKDGEDDEGLDYFESMTLKLEEMKEEDYMPKPLVPENFKVEETASTLPTRTRKGPARRGRQKRDFQRDILPGLVPLSRNEVTEDIQTFGGIMKATGHSWQSGLTRRSSTRNGSGRGRGRPRRQTQVTPSSSPPVVTNESSTPLTQQLNNIEVALEDRSLTGWGKTTRRPRRQRGPPAGNPLLIPIT